MGFYLKPTVGIRIDELVGDAHWLEAAEEHPGWLERKDLIVADLERIKPPSLKFFKDPKVIASILTHCTLKVGKELPDRVLVNPRTWLAVNPEEILQGGEICYNIKEDKCYAYSDGEWLILGSGEDYGQGHTP